MAGEKILVVDDETSMTQFLSIVLKKEGYQVTAVNGQTIDRLIRDGQLNMVTFRDLIAEGFNLFNRFNEAAANPFYQVVNAWGERASSGKYYSQPTSAFDPRQFQFGAKFNF